MPGPFAHLSEQPRSALLTTAVPAVVAATAAATAPGAVADAAPPAQAAKAADRAEDDDEDAEAGKKAEKPKAKSKAKKKAKADEDEGGEEDDEGDDDSDGDEMSAAASPAIRAARRRERARCAAIFADAAAGNNPALAAQIAFGTDLPRAQAIGLLKVGGSRPGGLHARMQAAAIPNPGPDAPPPATGAQAIAAEIVRNYEQARGLKTNSK